MPASARMLAPHLAPDQNSFNLIRLTAALTVLLSHLLIIQAGSDTLDPLLQVTPFTLGQHAVNAFFFLSGLMLSQSVERRPDLADYLWARFLRIVPGLFVFGLLMAFVAGPLLSSSHPLDYFSDPHTWIYPFAILVEFAKAAPPHHVFQGLPYAEAVNTPLWTIKYEILAYGVLAAFSAAGWTRRTGTLWGALAFALVLFTAQAALENVGDTSHLYQLGRYGFCFTLGMMAFHYRERVSLALAWFLGSVLLVVVTRGTALEHAAYVVLVAHGVMLAGTRTYGALTKATQRHDISYGVYIYHWPVAQALLVEIPGIGMPLLLALTLLITLPLAVASWRYVEAPALRLKNRMPRLLLRRA
ncbi:MAG TPA: acyltransferase [Pseudolabrys sp.]|nr:acyltransferase [Pseudolabrys sp.]